MTTSADPRYDDLSALFFNCTLKPSPQLSHTQGLMDLSAAIMRKHGVRVETIRAVDHDIATGVWPDMTEHGAATDAWPSLYPKVLDADILAARAAGAALSSVRVGSRSPLAFQGTPDDARPSPGPVRCSWPCLRRGQRPAPDPDRPADRR